MFKISTTIGGKKIRDFCGDYKTLEGFEEARGQWFAMLYGTELKDLKVGTNDFGGYWEPQIVVEEI